MIGDDFFYSEEVKQVEIEFGVQPGFLKCYVNVVPERPPAAEEIISIDIETLCFNPVVDGVKESLNFLVPAEKNSTSDDEWGDYAHVPPKVRLPPSEKISTMVNTEEEAKSILLHSEWFSNSANVADILIDSQTRKQLLEVIKKWVHHSDNKKMVEKLVACVFKFADKLGHYEFLVNVFVEVAANPEPFANVIQTMLAVLSRRVLLIQDPVCLRKVYSTVAGLVTSTRFIEVYKMQDNQLRAFQRWFACHATNTALKPCLPVGFKFISG